MPQNNELERLSPNSAGSAAYWARYVADWTAWNHLRTLGPLAAAGLLNLSLRRT